MIQFGDLTSPPMAWTVFSETYPDEAIVGPVVAPIEWTPGRQLELVRGNADVNDAIKPIPNDQPKTGDPWLIMPAQGDCHDYAVSKRARLLAQGWPESHLLLAECEIRDTGEHHLVLIVQTTRGDFVLDNLSPAIIAWEHKPYRWLRVQKPENPNYWARIE